MFTKLTNTEFQKATSWKVVLPFYVFAALSFLVGCILLLMNTGIVHQHYFHPRTLAITHLMALGWGTMIILGANHQLLPVLIEGALTSALLGYLSFIFAALGIPLLVTGFYVFHTGWVMQAGAILVNAGVICYLVNVITTFYESNRHDVHAWFIATASIWLFATTFFGLLLVFNFSLSWLPDNSIAYLSLHAHIGIVGWFLLLIIGVASRLIPMFLISEYTNKKILWWTYGLVNVALIAFILVSTLGAETIFYYAPFLLIIVSLALFLRFCYSAHRKRIRRQVDEQMKLSLLSALMLLLPLISLLVVIYFMPASDKANIVLLYGFCIFFGWITALIFGMTFKTLPFIVWHKVYHAHATANSPLPKDLFNESVFRLMSVLYLSGFLLFLPGIIFFNDILLKAGAAGLLLSATLYIFNVVKTITHQPAKSWT